MMLFTRRGGVGGGGIVRIAVCARIYWACLESRGFGGVVDRGPARNAENERRTKKDWTRVWCCAPYSVAVYTRRSRVTRWRRRQPAECAPSSLACSRRRGGRRWLFASLPLCEHACMCVCVCVLYTNNI